VGTQFEVATRLGLRVEKLDGTSRKWATYLDPLADTAEITLDLDTADLGHVVAGQSELHVLRDGVTVFAGPVWKLRPDLTAGTVQVSASGLASYLIDRVLTSSLTYASVDQASIFKALVDERGAEVGITCPTPTATGRLRDRVYNDVTKGKDYPYLATLISQLAGVIDGFDWHLDYPTRQARMWYPARGRVLDLPLVHGDNATVEPYDIDASPGTLATRAFGFGAGEGPAMLVAKATAPDLTAGYGTRDTKVSLKTDKLAATLLDNTRAYLARRAKARTVPSVLLRPDTEPNLGDFWLGDTLPVRARRGQLALSGAYRVVGIEVEPDQAGGEQVRAILGDPAEPRTEEEAA
jgi:hypothetical protein